MPLMGRVLFQNDGRVLVREGGKVDAMINVFDANLVKLAAFPEPITANGFKLLAYVP
jgi:hypothetical protein